MKISEVLELLKKYDLRPNKSFGQNFLINEDVLQKIVQAASITSEDRVVEIGPGLGALTKLLAQKAKKVTSIELDKKLIPILENQLKDYINIDLIQMDALKFFPPRSGYKVVANIPYNITSPLISHFLESDNRPTKMVLLIQKEVAEKICAESGKLNVLAIHVQIFGTPKIIEKVAAGNFYPPPKVDSAVIEINVHQKPLVKDFKKFFGIVHRAFHQKRKKLTNSLPDFKEKLIELGFQDLRPEKLSIEDWMKLGKEQFFDYAQV